MPLFLLQFLRGPADDHARLYLEVQEDTNGVEPFVIVCNHLESLHNAVTQRLPKGCDIAWYNMDNSQKHFNNFLSDNFDKHAQILLEQLRALLLLDSVAFNHQLIIFIINFTYPNLAVEYCIALRHLKEKIDKLIHYTQKLNSCGYNVDELFRVISVKLRDLNYKIIQVICVLAEFMGDPPVKKDLNFLEIYLAIVKIFFKKLKKANPSHTALVTIKINYRKLVDVADCIFLACGTLKHFLGEQDNSYGSVYSFLLENISDPNAFLDALFFCVSNQKQNHLFKATLNALLDFVRKRFDSYGIGMPFYISLTINGLKRLELAIDSYLHLFTNRIMESAECLWLFNSLGNEIYHFEQIINKINMVIRAAISQNIVSKSLLDLKKFAEIVYRLPKEKQLLVLQTTLVIFNKFSKSYGYVRSKNESDYFVDPGDTPIHCVVRSLSLIAKNQRLDQLSRAILSGKYDNSFSFDQIIDMLQKLIRIKPNFFNAAIDAHAQDHSFISPLDWRFTAPEDKAVCIVVHNDNGVGDLMHAYRIACLLSEKFKLQKEQIVVRLFLGKDTPEKLSRLLLTDLKIIASVIEVDDPRLYDVVSLAADCDTTEHSKYSHIILTGYITNKKTRFAGDPTTDVIDTRFFVPHVLHLSDATGQGATVFRYLGCFYLQYGCNTRSDGFWAKPRELANLPTPPESAALLAFIEKIGEKDFWSDANQRRVNIGYLRNSEYFLYWVSVAVERLSGQLDHTAPTCRLYFFGSRSDDTSFFNTTEVYLFDLARKAGFGFIKIIGDHFIKETVLNDGCKSCIVFVHKLMSTEILDTLHWYAVDGILAGSGDSSISATIISHSPGVIEPANFQYLFRAQFCAAHSILNKWFNLQCGLDLPTLDKRVAEALIMLKDGQLLDEWRTFCKNVPSIDKSLIRHFEGTGLGVSAAIGTSVNTTSRLFNEAAAQTDSTPGLVLKTKINP